MFSISALTKAHQGDVKSISCSVLQDGTLILASGSRDGKVKVWSISENGLSLLAEHGEHAGFVNAISVVPPVEDSGDDHTLILSGGVDKIVYVYDIQSMSVTGALIGHSSNICHLASSDSGLVLSCSWDKSARLWSGTLEAHVMHGHSEAVWGGCFVSSDHVVTASADKSLRLWHNGQMLRSFTGHEDVVRAVSMLPAALSSLGDFVSVGNDGIMLFWRLDEAEPVHVIPAHSSFIYTITCHDSFIATAGEDRTVKIWTLSVDKKITCVQSLPVPSASVWTLAFDLLGRIHCGSSDGHIFSFSILMDGTSNETAAEEFSALLSKSQLAPQQLESSQTTQNANVLRNPGANIGQVVLVRSDTNVGVVEAHQWDGNIWQKIGDVVDGSGADGGASRPQHNGVEYDFVFDVELDSGSSLKLPYNRGDNPYSAAGKFLADNNLGREMLDQVVEFLLKNTAGTTIEHRTGEMFNPYLEPLSKAEKPTSSFAGKVYRDCNVDGIMRKLAEFNALENEQNRISEGQQQHLRVCLASPDSPLPMDVISVLLKALEAWDTNHIFPLIDALRVIILFTGSDENAAVLAVLQSRKSDMSGCSSAVLTASRLVCNMLRSCAQSSTQSAIIYNEIIDLAVFLASRFYVLGIKDTCVPANLLAASWDYSILRKSAAVESLSPIILGRIRFIIGEEELQNYLMLLTAMTSYMDRSLASNIASELDILLESGRVPKMASAINTAIKKMRSIM